ncbi:RnfABCDGE type electron transport complex subunit D [Oceanispirochaeta sp.]|jgi:electron transport complex protein RnfD|uniref:RnfABCDGE type electron transport complex subunit D n=1 Tax=Oceanispirochaeta sp. TaxID=2035350 RepID=UPI0026171189|nr:RnfABCDGE type electron transport complex subunit D [Oceanispirochaeta sp.]MDA3956175.1 RnfABCDGE type electron transport complex subunit D [Oceanispirochaeta sp.]
MKDKLLITSSPQFHHSQSTASIMWTVSLCLLPAGIWGIYIFGMRALLVTLSAIIAAVGTEALLGLIKKENTVFDGSAFLTGLLIGYNMPPAVPLYIVIVASVIAIAVVKWTFGGLGANWMNPALAGRVFVFFSWTGGMTRWTLPHPGGPDVITGPTPLGSLKSGLMSMADTIHGPLDLLAAEGVPVSYMDLFLGKIPGSIGEVSALLLILGGLFLLIRKIANWEIVASYLGSFLLLVWVFGGFRYGQGAFSGDVLFHLLSGGLMLGVFFMATDMVTSPLTSKGMLIYGVGCGFMTFLLRFFGSVPEGVSLAIIFMNIFVPLINRAFQPEKFGLVKEEAAR